MPEMDLDKTRELCDRIVKEISGVFVGEDLLIRKMLAAALANGHILFEDNPGLGKTLLAKMLAFSIGCGFSRVQFTPDLLPADILGTKVWRQQDRTFELLKGPIFTNILLADEINRSPPKTQAALLEAMEERQVTIEGDTHRLVNPYFVLATQNPIEYEGTYPLPEAQMDRFMLRLSTGYAETLEKESLILLRRIDWKKDDPTVDVNPVVSTKQILAMQETVENGIYIDYAVVKYIAEIVRETRQHPKVKVGSSPRGGLSLLKASRAMALMLGRDFVTPDDVKMFAADALAHRIILKAEYVLEGIDAGQVVGDVMKEVPIPTDFHPR